MCCLSLCKIRNTRMCNVRRTRHHPPTRAARWPAPARIQTPSLNWRTAGSTFQWSLERVSDTSFSIETSKQTKKISDLAMSNPARTFRTDIIGYEVRHSWQSYSASIPGLDRMPATQDRMSEKRWRVYRSTTMCDPRNNTKQQHEKQHEKQKKTRKTTRKTTRKRSSLLRKLWNDPRNDLLRPPTHAKSKPWRCLGHLYMPEASPGVALSCWWLSVVRITVSKHDACCFFIRWSSCDVYSLNRIQFIPMNFMCYRCGIQFAV